MPNRQKGVRVTVAEIADAAGVSPRTFSNYFANKYEAMCAIRVDRAARMADDLLDRPAGEPLWQSLTAVAVAQFDEPDEVPDRAWLTALREVLESPRLRGEALKARDVAQRSLTRAVATRTGAAEDDLQPQLIAGAVTIACDVAVGRFRAADPPSAIEPLITDALRRFAGGLDPTTDHAQGGTMIDKQSMIGKQAVLDKQAGILAVDGGQLYYETRGAGPTLVLIPGGNGDVAPFEGIAALLADRFRIVAYERRGFSRSPLDGEPSADRLTADSRDLLAVLDHYGGDPAHLLGSSSGAIVALDFLTRWPDRVATAVAHEPPLVRLLPDADAALAAMDDAYQVWRQDGFEAGMAAFARSIGLPQTPGPWSAEALPPPMAEMMRRVGQNMTFWFEHELRQDPRALPDLEALRAARTRIVLGCGADSFGTIPHRPNLVLAERLGLEPMIFPGGHAGYTSDPAPFADRLADLLG